MNNGLLPRKTDHARRWTNGEESCYFAHKRVKILIERSLVIMLNSSCQQRGTCDRKIIEVKR